MLFAQHFIEAGTKRQKLPTDENDKIMAGWNRLNETMYSSAIAFNRINQLLFGQEEAATRLLPDSTLPFETNTHRFFVNLYAIRNKFHQWQFIPIGKYPTAHRQLYEILMNPTYPLFGVLNEVFSERSSGKPLIEYVFAEMLLSTGRDLSILEKEAIIINVGNKLELIRNSMVTYRDQVLTQIELQDSRLVDLRRGSPPSTAPPPTDIVVIEDSPPRKDEYVPIQIDNIPIPEAQPPPNFTYDNVLDLTKRVIRFSLLRFNYFTRAIIPSTIEPLTRGYGDTLLEKFLADPLQKLGRTTRKVLNIQIYNNWMLIINEVVTFLSNGRSTEATRLRDFHSALETSRYFYRADPVGWSKERIILDAFKTIALTHLLTFGQPKDPSIAGAKRTFDTPNLPERARAIVAGTPIAGPEYNPFWWPDLPPEQTLTQQPTVTVLAPPKPTRSVFAPPSPAPRRSPMATPPPTFVSVSPSPPVATPPPRRSPVATPPTIVDISPSPPPQVINITPSPAKRLSPESPSSESEEEEEVYEQEELPDDGTVAITPELVLNEADSNALRVAKVMFKNVFCVWGRFLTYTMDDFVDFYNQPDMPVEGVTTVNGRIYQNWLYLLRVSAYNIYREQNFHLFNRIAQVIETTQFNSTATFLRDFVKFRDDMDDRIENATLEELMDNPYIAYDMFERFLENKTNLYLKDDIETVKRLIPEIYRRRPTPKSDSRLEMIQKFFDSPQQAFMEADIYDRDYMVVWCLKTLTLTTFAHLRYSVTDQLVVPFTSDHADLIEEMKRTLDKDLLQGDFMYDIFWEHEPLMSFTNLIEHTPTPKIKSHERLEAEQALKFLLTSWRPFLPPTDEKLQDFLETPQTFPQGATVNARVYQHWLSVLRHARFEILKKKNQDLITKLRALPMRGKDSMFVMRFGYLIDSLDRRVASMREDDEDPFPIHTAVRAFLTTKDPSSDKLILKKPLLEAEASQQDARLSFIDESFGRLTSFKDEDDLPEEEMVIWCLKSLALTLIMLVNGINEQQPFFFFDESERSAIARAKAAMADTELVTNPFYRTFWVIAETPLPLFTPSPAAPSPARVAPSSPAVPSPARMIPSSPAAPSPQTPTVSTPNFDYIQPAYAVPAELDQIKQFVVYSLGMGKIADAPDLLVTHFLATSDRESLYQNWRQALTELVVLRFKRNNQNLLHAVLTESRQYTKITKEIYEKIKTDVLKLLNDNETLMFVNDVNAIDYSAFRILPVVNEITEDQVRYGLLNDLDVWKERNAEFTEATRRLHRLVAALTYRDQGFMPANPALSDAQQMAFYYMTMTITQIMYLVANVNARELFYFTDENIVAVAPYLKGSILAQPEFAEYWHIPYVAPPTPTNIVPPQELQDDVDEDSSSSSSEEESSTEEDVPQLQDDDDHPELDDDLDEGDDGEFYQMIDANDHKDLLAWRLKTILLLFMYQTDPELFANARNYLFTYRGARVSINDLASIFADELASGPQELCGPLREVLLASRETTFPKIKSLLGHERRVMFWVADCLLGYVGESNRLEWLLEVGKVTTLFGIGGHNDALVRRIVIDVLYKDLAPQEEITWDSLFNKLGVTSPYSAPALEEVTLYVQSTEAEFHFDVVEAYIEMYRLNASLDELVALSEKGINIRTRFESAIDQSVLTYQHIVADIVRDIEGDNPSVLGQVMQLWLRIGGPCLLLILHRTMLTVGTTPATAAWELLAEAIEKYTEATAKALHNGWTLAFMKLAAVIAGQRPYLVKYEDPCWVNLMQALGNPVPQDMIATVKKFAHDFKSFAPTQLILDNMTDTKRGYYLFPEFLQQILGPNTVNINLMHSPVPNRRDIDAFIAKLAMKFNEPLPTFFDSIDGQENSYLRFAYLLSVRLTKEDDPWAKTIAAWVNRWDWYFNFPRLEDSDVSDLVEKWRSSSTITKVLAQGPAGFEAFFFDQVGKAQSREEAVRVAVDVLNRIDDRYTRLRSIAIDFIRKDVVGEPELVVTPLSDPQELPFMPTTTIRTPNLKAFPGLTWSNNSCWADSLIAAYLIPAAMLATNPPNNFYAKFFDVLRRGTNPTKQLVDLRTQLMDELTDMKSRVGIKCDPNETQVTFVEQTLACSLQTWEVVDDGTLAGRHLFDLISPGPGLLVLEGTPDVISIRTTDNALNPDDTLRYIVPFADTYRGAKYRLVSAILYDGDHYRTLLFMTGQTPEHHLIELGENQYVGDQVWVSDPIATLVNGDRKNRFEKAQFYIDRKVVNTPHLLMRDYETLMTKTDVKDVLPTFFKKGLKWKPVQWIYVRVGEDESAPRVLLTNPPVSSPEPSSSSSSTEPVVRPRPPPRRPQPEKDELDDTTSTSSSSSDNDVKVLPHPDPKNAKPAPPTTVYDSRPGTVLAKPDFKNVVEIINGKPTMEYTPFEGKLPVYEWNNQSCSYDALFMAFLFPYAQYNDQTTLNGAEIYKYLLDKVFNEYNMLNKPAVASRALLIIKEAYIKRVFTREKRSDCTLTGDPMNLFSTLLQDIFQKDVTSKGQPVYGVKWGYYFYRDTPVDDGDTPSIFSTVYDTIAARPPTGKSNDLPNLVVIHTPRLDTYDILKSRKIPFMHYNGTQRFRLNSVILYNGAHFRTLLFVSHQSPIKVNIQLAGWRYLQNGIWFMDNWLSPFLVYKKVPELQNYFDGKVSDAIDFMTKTRPNEINLADVIDRFGNDDPPTLRYTPVGFIYIYDKRLRPSAPPSSSSSESSSKKRVTFSDTPPETFLIETPPPFIEPVDISYAFNTSKERGIRARKVFKRFLKNDLPYELRNSNFQRILIPPTEESPQFLYIAPVLDEFADVPYKDTTLLEEFNEGMILFASTTTGEYNVDSFNYLINSSDAWLNAVTWIFDILVVAVNQQLLSYDTFYVQWCYFSYFTPTEGWSKEPFQFEEDMLAELYIKQNPDQTVTPEQALAVRDNLSKYDEMLFNKYKDLNGYRRIFTDAVLTQVTTFTNLVNLFKFIWKKIIFSPLFGPSYSDGRAFKDCLTLLQWLVDPFFTDRNLPLNEQS